MRHVAHTEGKLKAGDEVNNGTGGQRHTLFAGKPCSFNTIGGVTGTQRAFQSRTKEQGRDGVGQRWVRKGTSRKNRPKCKYGIPQSRPGYKRRIP